MPFGDLAKVDAVDEEGVEGHELEGAGSDVRGSEARAVGGISGALVEELGELGDDHLPCGRVVDVAGGRGVRQSECRSGADGASGIEVRVALRRDHGRDEGGDARSGRRRGRPKHAAKGASGVVAGDAVVDELGQALALDSGDPVGADEGRAPVIGVPEPAALAPPEGSAALRELFGQVASGGRRRRWVEKEAGGGVEAGGGGIVGEVAQDAAEEALDRSDV